jgi:enamine deaminase RidA (YjgF/YER057c/UK114 family)
LIAHDHKGRPSVYLAGTAFYLALAIAPGWVRTSGHGNFDFVKAGQQNTGFEKRMNLSRRRSVHLWEDFSMSQQSRQHVSTCSPFEPKVGISRAVRAGNIIAVTGTAPLSSDGKTVTKGDAAGQTRRCLEIIQSAIEGLGGTLANVTRTRILLTRIEDWEQVAVVHSEFFADTRPANTIMQVVRFIDSDWLVEIEADAVVES